MFGFLKWLQAWSLAMQKVFEGKSQELGIVLEYIFNEYFTKFGIVIVSLNSAIQVCCTLITREP